MTNPSEILREFDETGRFWLRNALSKDELETLRKQSTLGRHPGA